MMKDRNYKCPVCGAPVEGFKCEYCGCVIYDFAVIDTDRPTYIRMRIKNPADGHSYIMQTKAVAVNPAIEIRSDEVSAVDFMGNAISTVQINQTCTMSVDFQSMPDEDGHLFTLIDAERPWRSENDLLE